MLSGEAPHAGIGGFARDLLREIGEDDLDGLAAEMAYRFLLALAPALVLLVSVVGFIDFGTALERADSFIELLAPFIPLSVTEGLHDAVVSLLGRRSTEFLTIGLLGTIWGASSVVTTLMKGVARAYDATAPRSARRRIAIALGTTMLAPLIALALVAATDGGRALALWLTAAAGGPVLLIGAVISALATPVAAAIVVVALSLLYQHLPGLTVSWRSGLPGTLFTTVALFALANAFGLLADSFAPQGALFGFGAAFALLIWMHAASFALLVGAEINALLLARKAMGHLAAARDP